MDKNISTPCLWDRLFFSVSNETIIGNQTEILPFNADTTLFNLFKKGEPIYWETGRGALVLIGSAVVLLVFFMVKIPSGEGKKKVGIPKYIVIKSKKLKKRRR